MSAAVAVYVLQWLLFCEHGKNVTHNECCMCVTVNLCCGAVRAIIGGCCSLMLLMLAITHVNSPCLLDSEYVWMYVCCSLLQLRFVVGVLGVRLLSAC